MSGGKRCTKCGTRLNQYHDAELCYACSPRLEFTDDFIALLEVVSDQDIIDIAEAMAPMFEEHSVPLNGM
jgi:hypothetical protein